MTSRWRPKNRRQILQLNDEVTPNLPVPTPAASAPNKLHALLGHYNSDDEDSGDLEEEDVQFKDFMNEIKAEQTETTETPADTSEWQELWDPQSGQPYYWNTISNELTWDKPQDLIKPTVTSNAIIKVDGNTKGEKLEILSTTIEPGKSNVNSRPGSNQQSSSEEPGDIKTTEPSVAIKKEETKISFKLVDRSASSALTSTKLTSENIHAKTNGKLTIDADSIIAAIEKEVPPDYKSEVFVPLFRRRPLENSGKPKLGVNFKTFFQPKREAILQEPQDSDAAPLVIVNTHRGLGYQDKENEAPPINQKEEVQFVAGEILTPLVVEPEPIILSVEDKILRLERRLEEDLLDGLLKTQITAQLDVLKDAWLLKQLETGYLDTWLEKMETKLTKEPKIENQVIDMVIEDSESDNPGTPGNAAEEATDTMNRVEEGLDSALNSFYTDLATLDTNEPEQPVAPEPVTVPEPVVVPTGAVPAVTPVPALNTTAAAAAAPPPPPPPDVPKPSDSEAVDEVGGDPIKGIKRSKMSQDMTSLVAKWQKIHKANT